MQSDLNSKSGLYLSQSYLAPSAGVQNTLTTQSSAPVHENGVCPSELFAAQLWLLLAYFAGYSEGMHPFLRLPDYITWSSDIRNSALGLFRAARHQLQRKCLQMVLSDYRHLLQKLKCKRIVTCLAQGGSRCQARAMLSCSACIWLLSDVQGMQSCQGITLFNSCNLLLSLTPAQVTFLEVLQTVKVRHTTCSRQAACLCDCLAGNDSLTWLVTRLKMWE